MLCLLALFRAAPECRSTARQSLGCACALWRSDQAGEAVKLVALRRKTRGLGAGRKLRNHRRKNLWADKDYKKSHLGNEWKKPFAGASHAKGIVLEKMCAPSPALATVVVCAAARGEPGEPLLAACTG